MGQRQHLIMLSCSIARKGGLSTGWSLLRLGRIASKFGRPMPPSEACGNRSLLPLQDAALLTFLASLPLGAVMFAVIAPGVIFSAVNGNHCITSSITDSSSVSFAALCCFSSVSSRSCQRSLTS
jgi:hypothetical protein